MTSPTLQPDHLRFDYHLKAEHLHDSLHMERAKRLVKNAIVWLLCVGFIRIAVKPRGLARGYKAAIR